MVMDMTMLMYLVLAE